MTYKINLNEEELEAVKNRKKNERDAKVLRRLQCIQMKHQGKRNGEIAEIVGVTRDTITDWIVIYRAEGLEGLCNFRYEGRRKSKLDDLQEEIKTFVDKENVTTLNQVQKWLADVHNVGVEHSWLFRYCKKNSISLTRKSD